jgi:hypothetical protein
MYIWTQICAYIYFCNYIYAYTCSYLSIYQYLDTYVGKFSDLKVIFKDVLFFHLKYC